jgi:hypothetical protein
MAEQANRLFNPLIQPGGLAADPIAALAQQLRAQGGNWDIGGIDRATEFARELVGGGFTSLDGLSIGNATDGADSFWLQNAAGQQFRGFGDVSKNAGNSLMRYMDGGYAMNEGGQEAPYVDTRPGTYGVGKVGTGKGVTMLNAVTGQDGRVSFQPEWQDSSDKDHIKLALAAAAAMGGAYFGGLGGGGSAAASGGGSGAAAAGGGGAASSAIPYLTADMAAGLGAVGAPSAASLVPGGLAGLGGMGAAGAGLAGAAGAAGAAGGGTAAAGGLTGALGTLGKYANVLAPVIGAGTQMYTAGKALDAQQQATQQSNDLLRYMYDTTRADNMPALDARNSGLTQANALLQNPASITSQPGYQFGMNQGVKALENSAAARGMTYSGQQGKALTQFGQDYAGSKLDQSVNRLLQLSNAGSGGAAQIGNAGTAYGNNAAGNLSSLGDARAMAGIAQGNAFGNAVNQLTAYGNQNKWWQG